MRTAQRPQPTAHLVPGPNDADAEIKVPPGSLISERCQPRGASSIASALLLETGGCAGSRAGKLLPLAHGKAAAVRQPSHRRPVRARARPGSLGAWNAAGCAALPASWLAQPLRGTAPWSPAQQRGPAPVGGRRPGRPATTCSRRSLAAEFSHTDGCAALPKPSAAFPGTQPCRPTARRFQWRLQKRLWRQLLPWRPCCKRGERRHRRLDQPPAPPRDTLRCARRQLASAGACALTARRRQIRLPRWSLHTPRAHVRCWRGAATQGRAATFFTPPPPTGSPSWGEDGHVSGCLPDAWSLHGAGEGGAGEGAALNEEVAAQEPESTPLGFRHASHPHGSPGNVAHFRTLLAAHPEAKVRRRRRRPRSALPPWCGKDGGGPCVRMAVGSLGGVCGRWLDEAARRGLAVRRAQIGRGLTAGAPAPAPADVRHLAAAASVGREPGLMQ